MSRSSLLIEIGCEEIPARMIPRAAADFAGRVQKIIGKAGLGTAVPEFWGGPRRLAVRIADVEARQADRDEELTGPSAEVAFDSEGAPTRAALGFAKKQGIAPADLQVIETDRGRYVGVRRTVAGKSVAEVLAESLPASVAQMSFPKSMRWADGSYRWVRPVHWIVALSGADELELQMFGIQASRESQGHRFLHTGPVRIDRAESYEKQLEAAHVVIDPGRRRDLLASALQAAAMEEGGTLIEDSRLLDEITGLVEWPGVVAGKFEERFLALPKELLVTTLRYHQKCFSTRSSSGEALPVFCAVANTDLDPAGHVRRGNEWVVGGRLDDAAFFWKEDLKLSLASRLNELSRVGLHPKLGSYAEKAERMATIAESVAKFLSLDPSVMTHCAEAARLAKIDLVTGTVGEFPELQGRVGGLLLQHEGRQEGVSRGVYEHYQPAGPGDSVPASVEGAIVSLADRLDAVVSFIGIGEVPTGSRDPFGLRRSANGIFRIVFEHRLQLSLDDLVRLGGAEEMAGRFLGERLVRFLRDSGYSSNEVSAVLRPQLSATEFAGWKLPSIWARLEAITVIRGREDFDKLVELTQRVQNILATNEEKVAALDRDATYEESDASAQDLFAQIQRGETLLQQSADAEDYGKIVETLAEFIDPVERFFTNVLVMNEGDPAATISRYELLSRLRVLLTRHFDIRELAGEAERRA